MAKETIVRIVDDIDGSAADKSVRFSWQGTHYQIDLSAKNARAFEAAVQPYVKAAKRVAPTRRTSAGRSSARKIATTDLALVREWAKGMGHQVSDRGRIAQSVIDAFRSAHESAAADSPAATQPARSPSRRTARKATARKAVARKAGAGRRAAPGATARKRVAVK